MQNNVGTETLTYLFNTYAGHLKGPPGKLLDVLSRSAAPVNRSPFRPLFSSATPFPEVNLFPEEGTWHFICKLVGYEINVDLDFLQNCKGQTLAAAYSVRPVEGASVSTPLRWSEVKKGLDPSSFNIHTIEKRLDKVGDLWLPVLEDGMDREEIDLEKLERNLL